MSTICDRGSHSDEVDHNDIASKILGSIYILSENRASAEWPAYSEHAILPWDDRRIRQVHIDGAYLCANRVA